MTAPLKGPSKESLMALRLDVRADRDRWNEHVHWFNETYVKSGGKPLHRGIRLVDPDSHTFTAPMLAVSLCVHEPLEKQLAVEEFLPLIEPVSMDVPEGDHSALVRGKLLAVHHNGYDRVVLTLRGGRANVQVYGSPRRGKEDAVVGSPSTAATREKHPPLSSGTCTVVSTPDLMTALRYIHRRYRYDLTMNEPWLHEF